MKTIVLSLMVSISFLLMGCNQSKQSNKEVVSVAPVCSTVPLTTDNGWYESGQKAPLFDNLGNYSFPVSCANALVQRYFDQGLILSYGFNHAEAARSFYYATQLDPECAMAYWGYAYVLGPNYNSGMASENYGKAFGAIQKALALSEKGTAKERELIQAMAERYAPEAPESRADLDKAYSEALKKLASTYPDDAEIGTLYAESLMNLHPWDLYERDGTPKDWTPEIVATLEKVIQQHPRHPGAHHFYIHAVEASESPERGYPSAKLYDEGLVPGAGHLVHMSSHIYINTGDYHKGTLANIRAVAVDSAYTTACHAQGVYPLAYYPHNYHFLAATATLEGNSEWGIRAAEKMARQVSIPLMQEPGWGTLQHYYCIPYYVYVKFGKWDKILTLTNKVPSLAYPSVVLAYARGMAYLGKGEIEQAKAELAQLEQLATDEQLKSLTVWDVNSVSQLVAIANGVLKAEILARETQYEEAIVLLKEAVAIEDGLNYNEPPDWFFSVRHHLGAVQLEAEKYRDAIETYADDLQVLPRNGWALHGLKKAYEQVGDQERAQEVESRLSESWADADISISGSRIL